MLKKYFVIAIIAISILSVLPVSAAKPDKEPVDRIVFVHYPKGFEQKPESPGKPSNNTNCPNPNTCTDYKNSGIKWPAMPVSYVIDPTNMDRVSPLDIKAAVELGFNAWHLAEPNANFINASPIGTSTITSDPTTASDNINSVTFRNISAKYPNALAVTFVWYTRFGRQITEVDTVFNDAYKWSYTDPTSWPKIGAYGDYANTGLLSYDIGNIITHEQGHWLMLNDLYSTSDSELTMYGYGAKGEMKKISLGWGDKLGIQKIY